MPISASVRSHGARTGTAVAAALAVAGFTLAGAPAAFAAPGDSGDLSVQPADHARGNHRAGDVAKVCEFRLVAANFETFTPVVWTIVQQPPAVPPNTLTGTLPLTQGVGTTQDYQLPDGTYLLTWTVPSGPKTKTFKVDCSKEDKKEARHGSKNDGSSWSDNKKDDGSSWSGSDKEHSRPSGAVPAGGGGVPTMESVSSDSGSNTAMTTALVSGAVGLAGLIFVRRAARRRSSGAA